MSKSGLKDKVVLVFDDNLITAKYTSKNIERILGCVCIYYDDAHECLAEINAGIKFDLFLVDLGVDL